MAAAVNPKSNGDLPRWWAERNNKQAERLLKSVNKAKPVGIPVLPQVGGDHPRPQGFFVKFLFQPYVWPEDSETLLNNDGDKLLDESNFHEDKAMDARQASNGCLTAAHGWVRARTLLVRPTARRRRSSSTKPRSAESLRD